MHPLVMPSLIFVGSAAVIVVAGIFLTRFTDQLADLTGMGRTLAGMLLLAIATSLPELTVDANLASKGFTDIAIGTLLGSNLMNLMLLAIMDLNRHSRGRMISSMASAHTLSALASVMLTAVVLLLLLLRPADLLPKSWHMLLGPGAIAIAITYALSIRLIFYDQQHSVGEVPAESDSPPRKGNAFALMVATTGYVLTAGVIFLVAPYLADASEKIASVTGLGETFIGTTLVALSTSLPEAITTLAAVRMGAFDLAVGNIFGSNCFNMLIVVVVDAFQPGPLFLTGVVSETHALTAIWSILVSNVAMMALLYRPKKRVWVLEPDSVLVIILVMCAMWTVFQNR